MSEHHPDTVALHGGQEPDPTTNSRAVPIYQTTSYVFDSTQHAQDLFALAEPGNIYTRIMNPTWDVLEQRVAALEGGIGALVTASGQAAVTYAVLNLTVPGDNIVSVSQLYGGTYNLFAHTLQRQFGVEVRWADANDPGAVAGLVDERTRLVFGETIGNPRLNVLDVPAWAEAAHAQGLPLVIDNTVPTPFGCRVLDHGADVAVHSLTKFLGGHGTSIGGAIVSGGDFDWTQSERFALVNQPDPAYHGVVWTDAVGPAAYLARLRTVMLRNTGAALSPFNAFLFLQGIESAHVRMPRHFDNALAIARHLDAHDAVSWVSYPGLDGSPDKEVADRVLTGGYGALVSFGVQGGREAGRAFIEALGLFSHLANIGDAKSLAIHNATTTHSQLNDEELEAAGVPQDLVRLSIGIEHVDDLIADLDQALAKAGQPAAA